jgi:group I intron endonuclease
MIENPTDKQLKTLTNIIYLIHNTKNNKYYVGQSTRTFHKRYRLKKWWRGTKNEYLINSVNKHGPENFQITILEYNIESLDKLNELEDFYAIKYNSYYPDGYNLNKCGKNKRKNEITIMKAAKSYIFINPNGKIIKFKNMQRFCRENNLHQSAMNGLLTGKVLSHKGWAKYDKNDPLKFFNKSIKYIIKDKNENLINIKHGKIKAFCKENNLTESHFHAMLNGAECQCKGFRLVKNLTNLKIKPRELNPNYIKEIELINPNGETIKIKNVTKFCNGNMSMACGLRKLNSGHLKFYKGWTPPNLDKYNEKRANSFFLSRINR